MERIQNLDQQRIKPFDSEFQVIKDDHLLKPYESDIQLRIEEFNK